MFPKSTELPRKVIAKEKFYRFGDFTAKLKTAMTNDVAKITATHKLADKTLNIDAGKSFPEIMVLRVLLKKKDFDEKILDAMDRSIRAAIVLFVIEYEDKQRLSIAFKDKKGDNITIAKRWTTNWETNPVLKLEGRYVDAIYEGFIRQISGGKLIKATDKTLKEKVATVIQNEKTEREIERLLTKMKAEKQLKRKLEIKNEIKKLKEKL